MRIVATFNLLLLAVVATAAEPPKSPLSPEESLKHFVLADPNLQIEIVAAEPEVIDPVAIQFDEHGRLWVVELSDYPNGPEPGKPPLSRIKLLEDKDGDGRYETAHIFADKLLFATGVQPWDGGVIVTLAGEVAYFKDTDGDHKADVRETWFTGFAQANPQLRANHPTFGPDGWIYVANGLRGGNVIAVKKDWPVKAEGLGVRGQGLEKGQTQSSSSPPHLVTPSPPQSISHDPANPKPVSLTGRDFKFDPLTGRYEAISGNGQFGMTFDAWGNRFVCDNRHPCRQVIFEEDFIRRCPHVAFPAVVHDVIPADDKNQVFPLTSAWTTSNLHAGTFTAACGVTVYTGDWLPEEFRGNVFVCEPTGNLVQRAILEPDGVTFKSQNPYARRTGGVSPLVDQNAPKTTNETKGLTPPVRQGTQEFLASRDDWFRPVDLQNGPDGALYVVDMYRAVIEHPEWVPDELKKRPDTWLGNDKGRIYRIRPRGQLTRRIAKLDGENIKSRNGWSNQTTKRIRRESNQELAQECRSPGSHLWPVPSGLNAQSRDALLRSYIAGSDQSDEHRAVAKKELGRWIIDPDPRIRMRALQAMRMDSEMDLATADTLVNLTINDGHDPFIRMAVIAATGQHQTPVLRGILSWLSESPDHWSHDGVFPVIQMLCELIGARNSVEELSEATIILRKAWRVGPYESLQGISAAFDGLAAGLLRKGTNLRASVRNLHPDAQEAFVGMIDDVLNVVESDKDISQKARVATIRFLRHAANDKGIVVLERLMETAEEQVLRLAAVESLSTYSQAEVGTRLVERYRSETPAIRRAILTALFASKERQLRLLEAIEQGQIAATELDPVRVNQLTQAKDETLRERAKKILAAAAPASRKEVLDAYQPALSLKGDPKRGRELFVKNCSTCHRVDNVGVNVAPDISDTRTKKPEQLLLDILDPNKAIDANYFAYAVVTKEGKTESGVISSETATSITLKQPEGKVLTLLRTDIDELRNTGLSLMPIGLEKNLDQQAIADLVFWLKNWRYLDGKVPATSLGK